MMMFSGQPLANYNLMRTQIIRPLTSVLSSDMNAEDKFVAIKDLFLTNNQERLMQYGLTSNISRKLFWSYVVPSIGMGLLTRGAPPETSHRNTRPRTDPYANRSPLGLKPMHEHGLAIWIRRCSSRS